MALKLRLRRGMAIAVVLLGAALAGSGHAAAPGTVEIDNFSFGPDTLTVAQGTQVVWTNHDDDPHTVVDTAATPRFKSAALDTGESFAFTFAEPGTYRYFCSVHPQMQGTVIVR